eukprot:2825149-Prymnesium_polylepis.1
MSPMTAPPLLPPPLDEPASGSTTGTPETMMGGSADVDAELRVDGVRCGGGGQGRAGGEGSVQAPPKAAAEAARELSWRWARALGAAHVGVSTSMALSQRGSTSIALPARPSADAAPPVPSASLASAACAPRAK